MSVASFDSDRAPTWVLKTIDYRKPHMGDLYITSRGTVQRAGFRPINQERAIVAETWDTGPGFSLATYSRPEPK